MFPPKNNNNNKVTPKTSPYYVLAVKNNNNTPKTSPYHALAVKNPRARSNSQAQIHENFS